MSPASARASDGHNGQDATRDGSSSSSYDGLLDLDGFLLLAGQLTAYNTLETLLKPMSYTEFGDVLEDRVHQFQRCKRRIKRAITKDFSKVGVWVRPSPLCRGEIECSCLTIKPLPGPGYPAASEEAVGHSPRAHPRVQEARSYHVQTNAREEIDSAAETRR